MICLNVGKGNKPWFPALPFRNIVRQMETINAQGAYIGQALPDAQGTYYGEFEGNGSILARGSCRIQDRRVEGNKTVFDYVVTGGSFGVIPIGDVKNLKIWQGGYRDETPTPFTDFWLSTFEPFAEIRWMDMIDSNNNDTDSLDFSAKVSDMIWSERKGIPWYAIFEASKHLNKGCWLNIPDRWDEASVDRLAQLASNYLKGTNVSISLENTNEYWNWRFPQAKRVQAAGDSAPKEWSMNIPDSYGTRHSWHARRTIRLGEIFRKYFPFNQIKPVLALQLAEHKTARPILNWVKHHYDEPNQVLYSTAVTSYFGHWDVTNLPNGASPEQVARAVLAGARRPDGGNFTALLKHYEIAKEYGLEFDVYEGGPDTGEGSTNLAAKIAAQDHPIYAEAIQANIDLVKSKVPNCRYFYFCSEGPENHSGQYGLRDSSGVVKTPKWLALEAAAKKYNGSIPLPPPPPVVIKLPQPTGLIITKIEGRLRLIWLRPANMPEGATYKMLRDNKVFDTSMNEDGWSDDIPGSYTIVTTKDGVDSEPSPPVVIKTEAELAKEALEVLITVGEQSGYYDQAQRVKEWYLK